MAIGAQSRDVFRMWSGRDDTGAESELVSSGWSIPLYPIDGDDALCRRADRPANIITIAVLLTCVTLVACYILAAERRKSIH